MESRHIVEGDVRLILVIELSLGLTHIEDPARPTAFAPRAGAHTAEHPYPKDKDQNQRSPVEEDYPKAGTLRLILDLYSDTLLLDKFVKTIYRRGHALDLILCLGNAKGEAPLLQVLQLLLAVDQPHLLRIDRSDSHSLRLVDLYLGSDLLAEQLLELRPPHLLTIRRLLGRQEKEHEQYEYSRQVDPHRIKATLATSWVRTLRVRSRSTQRVFNMLIHLCSLSSSPLKKRTTTPLVDLLAHLCSQRYKITY